MKSPGHQVTRSPVVQNLFLAVFSGALFSLAFPAANLEFLAWIAFVPLFSCLAAASKKRAFFLSYACGVVFWAMTIFWLAHVTLAGTILLVLYLALYFGVFGVITAGFLKDLRGNAVRPVIGCAASWVVLEYARSHLLTGFPWALAGYSQYLNIRFIQIADLAGVWGVSFMVVAVNAALYQALARAQAQAWKRPAVYAGLRTCAVVCAMLVAVAGYGVFALAGLSRAETRRPFSVAVIQGNIPQDRKWDPASRQGILDTYLGLSAQAAAEGAALLVWPEASLPVIPEEEPQFLEAVRAFAARQNVSVLIGAVTRREGSFYNSALLLSPDGAPAARYDKLHRVPFGEYIPFKRTFPFLETIAPIGDIAAGTEAAVLGAYLSYGPFHSVQSRFGVLICFEDVFPELARLFARHGVHFLVNITNDAWYQRTPAARQHFQASVFRAVENRMFVVRSANTGISGFISPAGETVAAVESAGEHIFVRGVRTHQLRLPRSAQTLFTALGDWFVAACAAALLVLSRRLRRLCPLCRWYSGTKEERCSM